jgi:hypothetical protein
MKNVKQLLGALLFFVVNTSIAMDNNKWEIANSREVKNCELTMQEIRDNPETYKEINSGIEGHRAFGKFELSGFGGRAVTVYHFDRDENLIDARWNQYRPRTGKKLSQRPGSRLKSVSWPSITKIIGGGFLICALIYGIKKLYDRNAEHAN